MYKRINLIKIKNSLVRYLRMKLSADMPISASNDSFDKLVKRYIKLYQSLSVLRRREEIAVIQSRKSQIKGLNLITLLGLLQVVIWPVISVAITGKEVDWHIEFILTVFPYAINMAVALFFLLGAYWAAQNDNKVKRLWGIGGLLNLMILWLIALFYQFFPGYSTAFSIMAYVSVVIGCIFPIYLILYYKDQEYTARVVALEHLLSHK